MKIFIVIFGSAFVGEIIQCKYSVLDAEDYCVKCEISGVKWFSVDYMTKKNFVQISAMKMADKANYEIKYYHSIQLVDFSSASKGK